MAAVAAAAAAAEAPAREVAQRAARALAQAGVERVLLYGSVARGDQRPTSDIDLVAIYDDLDYSQRHRRIATLERLACEATGRSVDVHVTDRAEWAIRTGKVPCSFEARIAPEAVELHNASSHDVDSHGPIDWNKEIGLPASLRETWHRICGGIDPRLRLWRQGGTYAEPQTPCQCPATGIESRVLRPQRPCSAVALCLHKGREASERHGCRAIMPALKCVLTTRTCWRWPTPIRCSCCRDLPRCLSMSGSMHPTCGTASAGRVMTGLSQPPVELAVLALSASENC